MKIQRRRGGYRIGVAILLCTGLLVGKVSGIQPVRIQAAVEGTVIASSLYVRSGPSTGYSKMTVNGQDVYLTKNTVVQILDEKNDWYYIETTFAGEKVKGYVSGKYVLVETEPTNTPAPTKAPQTSEGNAASDFSVPARIWVSELNIRKSAGTSGELLDTLKSGASVTVIGQTYAGAEKWYKVTYTSNGTQKTGYAYAPYVTLNGAIPTATPKPTATPTPKPTTPPSEGSGSYAEEFSVKARVTASVVNVRSGAGTDKALLTSLKYGASVTATGISYVGGETWYRISFDENGVKKVGYVYGPYITLSSAIPTATPTPQPTATPTPQPTATPTPKPTEAPAAENPGVEKYQYPAKVSATQLNLRKGPGTEHAVVVLLNHDDAVTVIGEAWKGTDKWYQVTVGEKSGYVLSDYICLEYKEYPDAVLTAQVRLRSGASANAAYVKNAAGAVAVLPANTVLSLTGEQTAAEEKWFAVSTEVNGEKLAGYVQAASVSLGKPAAPTPTPTPTPTPEPTLTPTPTPTPEVTPEPTMTPEPTTTPTPTMAPEPTLTPEPTMTPEPTEAPTPAATPAAQAKENEAGEQVGWGKASHPNASSMVLKILPKSGVGSVKVQGSTRAVTVTEENYLMLYGLYVDEKGNLYRHVGVTYRDKEYYGYILEERIKECEAPPTPTPGGDIDLSGSGGENQGVNADFELALKIQNFPESYKPYLRELHTKYPSWVFKAYNTGIIWDTAIKEENIPGKNLIPNSSGIEWKSLEEGAYNWKTDSFIVYDGSTWVTASKAALEYYMDPRNFLDDRSIFQFEVLTYEPSYQNLEGVESILKYTPLYRSTYLYEDEYAELRSISYGETFLKAAEYSGVSPYHLATRVKQEVVTGTSTVSNSVTGTVSGFEGLYNFYNIGAYHSTQPGGAIANGLKYAKYGSSSNSALNTASLIPWSNRYRAIVGGAYIIGNSYINKGQDTIYLQKFNMTPYYTYSHQYMANVVAPSSEGKKTAQAYTDATDSPIVFSIPVYLDMPAKACEAPTPAYNPNNYLAELSVETVDGKEYRLTPSFDGAASTHYSLIVDNDTKVVNIKAVPVSKKAVVSGEGYQTLAVGRNELTVCVLAEDGSRREYVLYVVRE